MTTDLHTLVLIVLCGVVTLLVRVIPFVMISRVNLPAIVIKYSYHFIYSSYYRWCNSTT